MADVVDINGHAVERREWHRLSWPSSNLGCLSCMLLLPSAVYYFYGCVVMHQGQLVVPDAAFWKKLYLELPAGIAIRPTGTAFLALILWIVSQALLEIVLPAATADGLKLRNGHRLKYRMNGLAAFLLTHMAIFGMCWQGLIEPYFVWQNMGALITAALVLSTLVAAWIYIDFGLGWHRHAAQAEFENDWGVFHLSIILADFWHGTASHPRLFHRFLTVPFDLKHFFVTRVGLGLWALSNESYIFAIWYDCRLKDGQVSCLSHEEGDWHHVSLSIFSTMCLQVLQILHFYVCEAEFLRSKELRYERLGWMQIYGNLGFLGLYSSFALCGYVAWQPEHLVDNHMAVYVGVSVYALGIWFFWSTNRQKSDFKEFIAKHGSLRLEFYKIWGQPVEYVQTENGKFLLCSGWWGKARHINYFGDFLLCLGCVMCCSGPRHPFPWIPLTYSLYFIAMDLRRMTRHERWAERKHQADWQKYKEIVPSKIIPGIY
eukprot:TRINITY_DN92300_c0_g1_i1.p1 TRINITY_DN92300_c0_g1~~TRINITY_DN92300_c0_g1_i1.p1  ORF type:complete len:487 (-),score=70.46 TRINITY_DN92300_c0_g1_i1:12-1472(-)